MKRLLVASIGVSAVLAVALVAVYLLHGGELALAQGADSVADVMTGAALLFAVAVSLRPPDEDHPFGHHSAQPVAALIVAVLVGVLAVEVLRSAIEALLGGAGARMGWALAAIVGAKAVVKGLFVVIARRSESSTSAGMQAFKTDALSDALIGTLSVLGLAAADLGGLPSLDAWLAIPVALWIFASGVLLGHESIRLLMGEAPSKERQRDLARVVEGIEGVRRIGVVRVRYHGNDLDVWAEIFVDPDLAIDEAHDIGEAAEARLLREEDVCRAVVHVDADRDTA